MSDRRQEVSDTTPEYYVRTNITRNTKGFQHETTVSIRWQDSPAVVPTTDGDQSTASILGALHRIADETARKEIALREAAERFRDNAA